MLAAERNWERSDEFIRRDRIWSEHALGWQGRLEIAIRDLWGENDNALDLSFAAAVKRSQVTRRLLLITLALRAFQMESGRLPNSLAELVPTVLPALPLDPYGNAPLVYRREGDVYLLYSLGPNGRDDSGQPLTSVDYFNNPAKSGDVVLETFFDPPGNSP